MLNREHFEGAKSKEHAAQKGEELASKKQRTNFVNRASV